MKIPVLIIYAFLIAQTAISAIYPLKIPTRVEDESKKYLSADLYSTDTLQKKPVILIQTPYNKDFFRLQYGSSLGGGTNIFIDTTIYNFVVVDWRGFYGSKDADIKSYNRGLDGYDIVEWIAAQAWSDGAVGTFGGSALGEIQFQTAREHPPHLVCAVPMIKDFKAKYENYYFGGVYRQEHCQNLVKLGFTTEDALLSHPVKDNVWKYIETNSDYADKIEIPMLLISGWFDHYPADVLRAFSDLQERSSNNVKSQHKLIIGPWLHIKVGETDQGILSFPGAEGVPVEAARRFFDYYMLGAKNGWILEAKTKYYETGTNKWKSCDNWLKLNRSLDTMYLNSEKRLTFEPPPPIMSPITIPPDTIIADPKDPSPTFGGSRFNPFDKKMETGPQDQRQLVESRKDALVYTSTVFEQDYELNGSIVANLVFSSDREDTDISLRLCDVFPDGKSVLLTQGIRRARFRNSYSAEELLVRRQKYKMEVTLEPLCHVFLKGHSLRLILSGSDFPMFAINPNNGKTLYVAGDSLTAENLIYRTAEEASFITIPQSATLSVNENVYDSDALMIAPNPATDFIEITFSVVILSEAKNPEFKIFDVFGREVNLTQSQDYPTPALPGGEGVKIDVSALPPGLYFVRFGGRVGKFLKI